jgi:hypothetical protein
MNMPTDHPRRFPALERWSFIDGLVVGILVTATASPAAQDYLLLLAFVLALASALVWLVSYQANK